MRPGSAQADAAYERQRDREADAYWAPDTHYCQSCECALDDDNTGDDDKCQQCSLEAMECPECGTNEPARCHADATAAYPETSYFLCGHCDHQWGHE